METVYKNSTRSRKTKRRRREEREGKDTAVKVVTNVAAARDSKAAPRKGFLPRETPKT